ncbi:MAG: DEAD/DEAH box helicase [Pseudomonadota bacterium]|nr:DEAD/DEAH box helicase [Pseudomonadota bacterium]
MNTATTQTFEQFKLDPFLLEKLAKQEITSPTQIQQEAIPVALAQKDILGSAETGSGKTLAFGLPIVHMLHARPDKKAVIIAPTRELAEQIAKNMQRLLPNRMNIALLIGGASIHKQLQQLRRNPQIVIGTPGRMIDHMERKKLKLDDTSILVLDETDRMLDMGFTEQINDIVSQTPDDRQTLLFSATVPKAIAATAKQFLVDPIRIKVGETTKPSDNIQQSFINVDQKKKTNMLIEEAEKREGSIIVFVKTKMGADSLCQQLQRNRFKADTIHGDLRHGRRQRVIRAYHQKRFRILVATDVAARGLDIPHVEHVINYDLPQCPEDYVHRIGRTGRGGRKGSAVAFVSQSDQFKLRAIKRFIGGDDNVEQPRANKSKPKKNKRFGNNNSDKWNKRSSGKKFGKNFERDGHGYSSDGNKKPYSRSSKPSSDRFERPGRDGQSHSSDGNKKPYSRSGKPRSDRFERSGKDGYSPTGNKKSYAKSSKSKSKRFDKNDNRPRRVFKKKESSDR